jgi:hypothetical protein
MFGLLFVPLHKCSMVLTQLDLFWLRHPHLVPLECTSPLDQALLHILQQDFPPKVCLFVLFDNNFGLYKYVCIGSFHQALTMTQTK